ncbi:MAG: hypothetical protein ACYS0G_08355 [Planctomycetota bacterium]|jgi:hypothetical protein
MTERRESSDGLIDAYLDGRLSGSERAAFERLIERRPERLAALERQQIIDEGLKRLMQPPSRERLRAIADRAVGRARPERGTPRRGWRPVARRLAVAAALAGGALGAWQIWEFLRADSRAGSPYKQQPWRSLAAVYGDALVDGFRPAWICDDDQEFEDAFRTAYRQRLRLAELAPDTAVLGLSYCNSITPRTTCLLARARGRDVMVFVDRVERDVDQPPPAGLHLFRRQVGKLVLYELSPLDEPAFLERFYGPDADDEGVGLDGIEEIEP